MIVDFIRSQTNQRICEHLSGGRAFHPLSFLFMNKCTEHPMAGRSSFSRTMGMTVNGDATPRPNLCTWKFRSWLDFNFVHRITQRLGDLWSAIFSWKRKLPPNFGCGKKTDAKENSNSDLMRVFFLARDTFSIDFHVLVRSKFWYVSCVLHLVPYVMGKYCHRSFEWSPATVSLVIDAKYCETQMHATCLCAF